MTLNFVISGFAYIFLWWCGSHDLRYNNFDTWFYIFQTPVTAFLVCKQKQITLKWNIATMRAMQMTGFKSCVFYVIRRRLNRYIFHKLCIGTVSWILSVCNMFLILKSSWFLAPLSTSKKSLFAQIALLKH